jgi:hypothetical protein
MADFIGNDGCYNACRVARDGAGQGARNWQAGLDVSVTGWQPSWRLIFATGWDPDDMNLIDGDFQLQWRNLSDGGSWTVLAASGEVKWATDTDLINASAVVAGEDAGAGNCGGMSEGRMDGWEVEGVSNIDLIDITPDYWFDVQFAVDMSGADPGDEYEFRVVETGTSNVQSDDPCAATVKIAEFGGAIAGITKDKNGSVLVDCKVALFLVTDEGPPEEYEFIESQISDGVTGAYSFTIYWDGSPPNFMVYAMKDDSPHVFDATDNVMQPV